MFIIVIISCRILQVVFEAPMKDSSLYAKNPVAPMADCSTLFADIKDLEFNHQQFSVDLEASVSYSASLPSSKEAYPNETKLL